ncbi:DUF1772 domain-containing protein [Microvirga sp. HBU67558]|uniref:DUF1772 domain-containing protein n=1 Tax=Microvirga TaxID=186650 RepID=UPI001B36AB06|nr:MULTISPECIES: DUF1772 domain-containing protein [unclassified Microvirga]MBQ0820799.1 DUF1772 domain-containing protein [Microvirga sp. HBU67558]
MLLRLIALSLTVIILLPSGAHLLELPGKIGLDRNAYFIVQQIYAGWALFSIPIAAALVANRALALTERRRDPGAARAAMCSVGLILMSLVVFFIWVFPANQATANWTQIPDNWETLRRQWEYGHLASAIIVFGALLATARATMHQAQARLNLPARPQPSAWFDF